jgi:hypothetical protein
MPQRSRACRARLAAAALLVLLTACAASRAGPVRPVASAAPVEHESEPVRTARQFFEWYLGLSQGPRGERRDAAAGELTAGGLAAEGLVTPAFAREMARRLAAQQDDFDPLLCARAAPYRIDAHVAEIAGSEARVVVHTNFTGHTIGVALERGGRAWRVSDVECPQEQAEGGQLTARQVTSRFYGWYVTYLDGALNDGAYRSQSDLTPGFIDQVEEQMAAGAVDPFLCDQGVPPRYRVDSAVTFGEVACVAVHPGGDAAEPFTVHLERGTAGWQIAGIHCPAP